MLILPEKVASAIIEQAKKGLPEEVCGYLAGTGDTVCRHYPLTNTDASGEHFSMDPSEQFAAVKEMRSLGLRPLAVYHSHPETPARPSKEDIRLAFDPRISYVIVSLAEKTPIIKSFKIRGGEVSLQDIKISEEVIP